MGAQLSIYSGETIENNSLPSSIQHNLQAIIDQIQSMHTVEQIQALNNIKQSLHDVSPFRDEPVDCVIWVDNEVLQANDYNPNSVAPPEMRLLEHSIQQDGYTQPIVTWPVEEGFEVIDGFHRNRVGKESPAVRKRVMGYLPITVVRHDRTDRNDRIASTIRHNRARGKHQVAAMSEIVVELKRRNWTTDRICRELGMDEDEVLRLCQITGLVDLFSDQQFSRAWDVEGEIDERFDALSDDDDYSAEVSVRTANTDDPKRIFHTWDKWECFKAGFYATSKPGMSKAQCEEAYRAFLSDDSRFRAALQSVITEWKHSCEHYLTNSAMNRIAWLGQAAASYAIGIPSAFRSGFYLLTESEQQTANATALEFLNKWLRANGREPVEMEEAYSYDRQTEIY